MGVLFSYLEGARCRLVRWDLETGRWDAIPTGGLLRDAIFDSDRAWLLTTHGLHEIGLEPFVSVHEDRHIVPKWCLGLRRIAGTNEALAWKRKGKSCLRLSLAGDGSARVSRPAPNLVTREGLALSFERGIGFVAERPHESFALPTASEAIEVLDRVYVTPGQLGPARNVSPAMCNDQVFDIHGDGTIVEWSRERGLGPRLVSLGAPVSGLDGPTRAGHLLARTEDRIVWIDLAKRAIVAEHPVYAGPLCVVDDVVLVPPFEPERPALLLGIGDDARGCIARCVPPRPPAPKTRAPRPSPEGAIADRSFSRIEVQAAVLPATFLRCTFRHCRVGAPDEPTTVRGVRFERCTFERNFLQNLAIEECSFEHVKLMGGWTSIEGIDLRRVVIAGPVDGTLIFQKLPPTLLARSGVDDWALDLSRGRFSGIELRGIPSRLVRRDPETQVVVRRERLLDGRYRTLPIGAFVITLGWIAEGELEDGVVIANVRGRKRAEEVEALALLRREGIAEQD